MKELKLSGPTEAIDEAIKKAALLKAAPFITFSFSTPCFLLWTF
jgi:hypothetical protein